MTAKEIDTTQLMIDARVVVIVHDLIVWSLRLKNTLKQTCEHANANAKMPSAPKISGPRQSNGDSCDLL